MVIKSKNESVATVNKSTVWVENGTATITVNGIKEGTTALSVSVDGAGFDEKVIAISKTININVTKPKTGSITVNRTSLNVKKGSSVTFKVSAVNASGKVTIKSNDSVVAIVDKPTVQLNNNEAVITVDGIKEGTTALNITIDGKDINKKPIKTTKTIIINVSK